GSAVARSVRVSGGASGSSYSATRRAWMYRDGRIARLPLESGIRALARPPPRRGSLRDNLPCSPRSRGGSRVARGCRNSGNHPLAAICARGPLRRGRPAAVLLCGLTPLVLRGRRHDVRRRLADVPDDAYRLERAQPVVGDVDLPPAEALAR